ncbi:lysozyme, partial [Escherichia coli]|uniref:lysozyme n=1 Tax=Escherichia coli TaxID=562 RepID=UPI001F30EFAE
QFDAMVSLAYNIGLGNFGKSTLLKKHNARCYTCAADQFRVWNRANGKVMNGLTKRRAAEREVYML